MNDESRMLVNPVPSQTLSTNQYDRFSFGSLAKIVVAGFDTLKVTDAVCFIALGLSIALLAGSVSTIVSSIRQSHRNIELIRSTTNYINEINQVSRTVDRLELIERRYLDSKANHEVKYVVRLRGSVNAELIQLERYASDGTLAPLLKSLNGTEQTPLTAQLRIGHENDADSRTDDGEALVSDLTTIALVNEYLAARHDQANSILIQQMGAERKLKSDLVTRSASLASGAALLFLVWYLMRRAKSVSNFRLQSSKAAAESNRRNTNEAESKATAIAAARVDERAMIAHNIHDELGALLMLLKIDLRRSSKSSVPARRAVDGQWAIMLDRVDQAMNTVSRITGTLTSDIVERFGLWRALETYAREFQKTIEIPCHLEINLDNCSPCNGEKANDIFRVFQESLTNVARHANASTLSINIIADNGRLSIEISDDGKGISPDQISDSHSSGLQGMYARARRVGGTLNIGTGQEGGTIVAFQIPLHFIQ